MLRRFALLLVVGLPLVGCKAPPDPAEKARAEEADARARMERSKQKLEGVDAEVKALQDEHARQRAAGKSAESAEKPADAPAAEASPPAAEAPSAP